MKPYRQRERQETFWHTRRPGGTLVPTTAGWLLHKQAQHRTAVRAVARVAVALLFLSLLVVHSTPAMGSLSPPPVPSSEQVCGSSILNGGPTSPPAGAVSVAAGDNSAVNFTLASTTYWFAPGTHTLGTGVFSQIVPGDNSTFIGAPGAVIDGQNLNQFAFGGNNFPVTIMYLTIQNFIPPGAQGAVNTNGIQDWTEEFNTEEHNLPGAATMLGTNSLLENNCLTENGEYGFNGFTVQDVSSLTGGPSNVTVSNNEISFNDTCNWEDDPFFAGPTPPAGCTGAGQFVGCGCSGGGKFWENDQGTYSDNYVHDNYAVGVWWDTNDVGWNITGNYISDSANDGLVYEISYNASITNNIFVDNSLTGGPHNPGFPNSAIFISESGSDTRVPGAFNTSSVIQGNQFYDNWGGVVLWENADRYCSSVANTSTGTCTLVNMTGPAPPAATILTCDPLNPANPDPTYVDSPPGIDDCRWKTQNWVVSGNLFDFAPADIGSDCTPVNFCGFNGLFSQFGSIAPFQGTGVEHNVTFNQDNVYSANTYCGPWLWDALEQGNQFDYTTWTSAPFSQDAGSTLNAPACFPGSNAGPPPARNWPGPQNRTVRVPARIGRH